MYDERELGASCEANWGVIVGVDYVVDWFGADS